MYYLTIEGIPIPWKAPYIGERCAFNPRYREKKQIQWQIKSQWRKDLIEGPIWCELIFHMPIPKSTSKKKKTLMDSNLVHHVQRPDRTNLAKLYEDCLIGIVIKDDSQIVDGPVRKIYGETPKTVIKIMELGKGILEIH